MHAASIAVFIFSSPSFFVPVSGGASRIRQAKALDRGRIRIKECESRSTQSPTAADWNLPSRTQEKSGLRTGGGCHRWNGSFASSVSSLLNACRIPEFSHRKLTNASLRSKPCAKQKLIVKSLFYIWIRRLTGPSAGPVEAGFLDRAPQLSDFGQSFGVMIVPVPPSGAGFSLRLFVAREAKFRKLKHAPHAGRNFKQGSDFAAIFYFAAPAEIPQL